MDELESGRRMRAARGNRPTIQSSVQFDAWATMLIHLHAIFSCL